MFQTLSGDTINLREKVGSRFRDLGLVLLEDRDGSLVEQIVSDCHHVASDIVGDILGRWVRGRGQQPVTWRTLVKVLYAIFLPQLAACIELSLS